MAHITKKVKKKEREIDEVKKSEKKIVVISVS